MITSKVINEIYKKFRKAPLDIEVLRIPYFTELLKHHDLKYENNELIIGALDEFNPFRRLLGRRIFGIIEFDKYVAFVTPAHILFLGKNDNSVQVHMKPDRKPNVFSRLFSGD